MNSSGKTGETSKGDEAMTPLYINKKVFTVGLRGDTLLEALQAASEYIEEEGEVNILRGYIEWTESDDWLIELQVSTHAK